MGYQPRKKSTKGAIHKYEKPLHEKRKDRKRIRRCNGAPNFEEKHNNTEREVSELTLKRLHTLGSQKFGSSPFDEHFERWLLNVEAALAEFQSHPSIGVDDQLVMECQQILAAIKLQLDERHRKEAELNQEIKNLSDSKNRLKQIDIEYATTLSEIRNQKNAQLKRLNIGIVEIKREQKEVLRMKTGFFRGISKKERERREIAVDEELNRKQTELELVLLDYSAKRRQLRNEYDAKRERVLKQLKDYHKKMKEADTDGSLEERWFACEALIDAVNSFLQRKAAQSHNPSKAYPA